MPVSCLMRPRGSKCLMYHFHRMYFRVCIMMKFVRKFQTCPGLFSGASRSVVCKITLVALDMQTNLHHVVAVILQALIMKDLNVIKSLFFINGILQAETRQAMSALTKFWPWNFDCHLEIRPLKYPKFFLFRNVQKIANFTKSLLNSI